MDMDKPAEREPTVFSVGFGSFTDGNTGIALMIAPGSFIETADDPVPGVMLSPTKAREMAFVLLLHAEQLAAGLVTVPGKNLQ